MGKKLITIIIVAALIVGLLVGCGIYNVVAYPHIAELPQSGTMAKAAVLYDGSQQSSEWEDSFSQLQQSLLLGLDVVALDVSEDCDLSEYNIIYPDPSVMDVDNAEKVRDTIVEFTENGGAVMLHNSFHDFFNPKFIGASEFVKLSGYPENMEYPKVSEDLLEIQSLVWDFASFYPNYSDFDRLSDLDYGYAAVADKAEVIVKCDKGALYTCNKYGKGYVLFTNPLLPNSYSINGFSMESRSEDQLSPASTTSSANQLFLNAFASFWCKREYGFSASRVFGCFGRPSMSWELHVEEITGMENGAMEIFGELAKEYGQIPSYTLIRNAYTWFLRAESVTYLMAKNKAGEVVFCPDDYENAYSSGTHVVAGDRWLSLAQIEDGGSYFEDYPDMKICASPWMGELTGNGMTDILCGSSDGYIYLFEGKGASGNYTTGEGEKLCDKNGDPLKVSGQSSPLIYDVNGDGARDILCGAEGGEIYVAYGAGGNSFNAFESFLTVPVEGLCFPEVGDLDNDGKADLIVGSDCGKLLVYYGQGYKGLVPEAGLITDFSDNFTALGKWLAPELFDLNYDGQKELAIGTVDGYVAVAEIEDGAPVMSRYLTCEEINYKGNHNIKFGNNCVPAFADLNNDGLSDLVCGSMEYGLAYPIDSPYFQFREELKNEVDYVLDNGFYISPHFYTSANASSAREAYELSAHKKALESYGIPTDQIWGTNQHTWHLSTLSPTQSFNSAYDAGLLWNSGYEPSGSTIVPQMAADNVMALPFFLMRDGKPTMLIQNCSTVLYTDEYWESITAKRDQPVCLYYHCDFVYEDEAPARQVFQTAQDFWDKYAYNFVSEDQMMRATAAAYNMTVEAKSADRKRFDVTLKPDYDSEDFPLFDEDYAESVGMKISFGEKLAGKKMSCNASVWYKDGNDLYVSADRTVRIWEHFSIGEHTHIERVNLPAEIEAEYEGAKIEFLDGGMMQCVVSGPASTNDEGWTVTEKNGRTVFTRFGDPVTLEINYK